jgi:hypothetical protein
MNVYYPPEQGIIMLFIEANEIVSLPTYCTCVVLTSLQVVEKCAIFVRYNIGEEY